MSRWEAVSHPVSQPFSLSLRSSQVSEGMLSVRDVAKVAMEARSAREHDEEMGEEVVGDSGEEPLLDKKNKKKIVKKRSWYGGEG